MIEPVQQHETPSGGWTYRDERTGISFKEHALTAILQRVHKSWIANNIEIPENWQAVIRQEICEQRPDIECREIGEPERFTTFADVERFAVTLKNWLSQGAQWVPQEEAERRAAICVACKENRHAKLCLGCTGLRWLAERSGMPSSSRDPELQSCRRCGCQNRIAIHVPKEALDTTGVTFPSHCWKA
jgi:hypothetical protein